MVLIGEGRLGDLKGLAFYVDAAAFVRNNMEPKDAGVLNAAEGAVRRGGEDPILKGGV